VIVSAGGVVVGGVVPVPVVVVSVGGVVLVGGGVVVVVSVVVGGGVDVVGGVVVVGSVVVVPVDVGAAASSVVSTTPDDWAASMVIGDCVSQSRPGPPGHDRSEVTR